MSVYFDSSALVAIYVNEAFSKVARRQAMAASQIPFTAFHELEVPNALRVLHGRNLISARELQDLLSQLQSDIDAHRLVATRVDLFAIFDRASELSKTHAARFLVRSLDILHVAAALELHCTRIVSGDDRQLALATASGLDATDVKSTHRRLVRRSRSR